MAVAKPLPFSAPSLESINPATEVVLELMRRQWPRTHRHFLGTRWQVPAARQPDYPHANHAAVHDAVLMLVGVKMGEVPLADPDIDCTATVFLVTSGWVDRGQKTLFLERELAEALRRTDLPEGFVPEDLRWRHRALRLFLPRGMFRVLSDGATLEPTCLTLLHLRPQDAIPLPGCVADDLTARGHTPERPVVMGTDRDRLTLAMQMRPSPEALQGANFYTDCILDGRTLTELARESATDTEPERWSSEEKDFLQDVKRLAFNVLLYLGSLPEEYAPEQVVRAGKEKKGQWRAELKAARFVGQELYRPETRPHAPHEPTGRRLAGHWRAGAWRRQPYGPKGSLRRLQWIKPYRTHGPEGPTDLSPSSPRNG